MSASLQLWRKRNHLTQVEAASLLGVSQSYLSLLEKGVRSVTPELRSRMAAVASLPKGANSSDDRLRADLSALGYPGFAHIKPSRTPVRPQVLLLTILSQPDADARIVDALPWVVRHCAAKMNFPWLVRQAKLRNLQNRLGFLLQTSGLDSPSVIGAIRELDSARLLKEDTLCWDSMRPGTRAMLRERRSPLAAHWHIVTSHDTEAVDSVN